MFFWDRQKQKWDIQVGILDKCPGLRGIRQINSRSHSIKMNSKISLFLFGILVTLAVFAVAENSEENSLSEEVNSSRLARSADEDAGRNKRRKNKKNSRRSKKNSRKSAKKTAKKNKSIKSQKTDKKAAKKAERKEKKAARKEKKNKTSKTNKSNKSQKERQSSRTVDGTCLESATIAMNRWRGVVANFNKQKTRIEKQSEIAAKKGDKKAVFAPIALKLVDLGGGNKSALTCSGSADSDGAKQLTNLTQTLFDCEVQVNKSCSMDFPAPNMTFVDQCTMDIEMFENKTSECYKMSKAETADDACNCWTDAEYTELGNTIKSCKIAETSAVAKGLKACKEAFSTCRKFEDDAVAAMAACAVPVDALKAKAAALSANVDSTNAAAAKVAAVTGGSSRRRSARAAASTCADFITLVENCKSISLMSQTNILF